MAPKTTERQRIITQEAFQVAPDLLGRPLAASWKRLAALAFDLIAVGFLTYTTSIGLALATFLACVWLSVRGSRTWGRRILAGALGTVLGLVAALIVLVTTDTTEYTASVGSWAEFGQAMATNDPATQQAALAKIQSEIDQVQVQDWEELAAGLNLSGILPDQTPQERAPLEPEALASLLERYAEELRLGEEAAVAEIHRKVQNAVAGAKLDSLEQRLQQVQKTQLGLVQENQELRAELDNPSLTRTVRAIAADLGLGVGWAAVYFVLFPSFLRGRTPGKRLLGLQIVRLDGRPLGPWNAFERFGGYAAGLATGLLGFLQILWDPNRQAVHDKIAGTVVVDMWRDRA